MDSSPTTMRNVELVEATVTMTMPAITLADNAQAVGSECSLDSIKRDSLEAVHEKRRRFSDKDKGTSPPEAILGQPRTAMSLDTGHAARLNTFPRSKESTSMLSAADTSRRGSFIWRNNSRASTSSSLTTMANIFLDEGEKSDASAPITPFNQVLHAVKSTSAIIETSTVNLKKLYARAGDKDSESEFAEDVSEVIGKLTGAREIMQVISASLDEMSTSGRAVGQFAANKFVAMLKEEVSAQPVVGEWISEQFTSTSRHMSSKSCEEGPTRPRHSIASFGHQHSHQHSHHQRSTPVKSPTLNHSHSVPVRRIAAIAEPSTDECDFPLVSASTPVLSGGSGTLQLHQPSLPVIDSASERSSSADDTEDTTMLTYIYDLTFATGLHGGQRCSDRIRLDELMNDIDSFDFNIFEVAAVTYNRPFVPVVMALLKEWRLLAELEISEQVMANYLTEIELKYKANPYHNSWHGADVAQTAFVLIVKAGLDKEYNALEMLGLLLSAAVHDVGHFGLNNDYLVKTRHELAVMYNDQSVLENMHVSTAIRLAEDPKKDCRIFEKLSVEESCDIRSRMIRLILATDPKKHVDMLGSFTAFVEGINVAENEGSVFSSNVTMEKSVVLETLLHSADISNPCKPHHLSMDWTDRIVSEFYNQGDMEKKQGFTPLKIFDRDSAGAMHSMQIGFIKGIVQPQWEAWDLFCREALEQTFEDPLDNLIANKAHWERVKEEKDNAEKEEKAKEEVAAGEGTSDGSTLSPDSAQSPKRNVPSSV